MKKECLQCNKEKILSLFVTDNRLKSGKSHTCKECWNKRQKSYRTPQLQKLYNSRAYKKFRNNKKTWAKILKQGRLRYQKFGRKKYPNTCIVCKKTFLSVRKDRKFCSRKCISSGSNNGRWLGGRQKTSRGYIKIYSPHHPFTINKNFVLEHRLVMEKHLGRFLNSEEVVHHINNNPSDNKIENLMLLPDSSSHTKLHTKKGVKGIIKSS